MQNIQTIAFRFPSHTGALFFILAGLVAVVTGCTAAPPEKHEEKAKPVRVQDTSVESRPVSLRYIGTTSSESIRKLGFKVGGKVARVFVDKGAHVVPGQRLAQLDKHDLRLAVRASRLSLRKATKAYKDAQAFFDKIASLYEQNARPQVDYDRARLHRDISKATMEQARVDYDLKRRMLKDCTLRADTTGFVVDVLNKPGEMVAAGYPVVLLRTEQQVVSVGVTQQDVKRIHVGTPARITIDDLEGEGRVINIGQVPDMQSRTYNVDVELTGDLAGQSFYIGSIARVAFQVGTSQGVWVPIPSVLTDGINYVYVVKDGRAVRKNLTLGSTSGNFVQVDGLEAGDQVIVEGMKNLKDGYKVVIQHDIANSSAAASDAVPHAG